MSTIADMCYRVGGKEEDIRAVLLIIDRVISIDTRSCQKTIGVGTIREVSGSSQNDINASFFRPGKPVNHCHAPRIYCYNTVG